MSKSKEELELKAKSMVVIYCIELFQLMGSHVTCVDKVSYKAGLLFYFQNQQQEPQELWELLELFIKLFSLFPKSIPGTLGTLGTLGTFLQIVIYHQNQDQDP